MESLGWSASEPRGLGSCSRPFQPGVPSSAPSTQVSPALSAHTSLCPLLPGLGIHLRLPWGGPVSSWQQRVAGGRGLRWEGGVGSGFLRQPGVGARAPAAMRYPPRECGPAAPPSASRELRGAALQGKEGRHPANRLFCSWLSTHPPTVKRLAPGSRAAHGGHTLLSLRSASCLGSLKQPYY